MATTPKCVSTGLGLTLQRQSRCQETEMYSPASHKVVDKPEWLINLRGEERDCGI